MTEISAMSLGRSGTSSMEDQVAAQPTHELQLLREHKSRSLSVDFGRLSAQDLSGFDSQQSKIFGMRQRQAVMTPFGSKTPPRSPSPEAGPLRRGAGSLPGSSVPSSVSTTANRRKVGFLDVQLNEDQVEEGSQLPSAAFGQCLQQQQQHSCNAVVCIQETPRMAQSTMPRRPAHSAQSAALARATTDPAAVTSAYESSQQQVASGIPPEDYDKILNEVRLRDPASTL